MDSCESLSEIEARLPNGFHDAYLETVTLDLAANTARMDLQLLVSDLDAVTEEEREAYRRATLQLKGLVYFVIDPPGPKGEWKQDGGVSLDAGDATDDSNPKAPRPLMPLPTGTFAYWFFVRDWNAFIHVAARGATLQWG